MQEVEIFPDDGGIKYTIPRDPSGTQQGHSGGAPESCQLWLDPVTAMACQALWLLEVLRFDFPQGPEGENPLKYLNHCLCTNSVASPLS